MSEYARSAIYGPLYTVRSTSPLEQARQEAPDRQEAPSLDFSTNSSVNVPRFGGWGFHPGREAGCLAPIALTFDTFSKDYTICSNEIQRRSVEWRCHNIHNLTNEH